MKNWTVQGKLDIFIYLFDFIWLIKFILGDDLTQ